MSDIHCYEKVQTTREKEEDSPGKTMPCLHTEDVCQNCLEKVQTSTEDSPKGYSLFYKKVSLLIDSFTIAAAGASLYLSAKTFFKVSNIAIDSILTTIAAPILKR